MGNITFYSAELRRELAVESINLKTNTFVVRPDLTTMVLDGADKLFDRTRAEARAEALKEAADRAIDWYIRTWKVSPVGPCADELRTVILSDEPKAEKEE